MGKKSREKRERRESEVSSAPHTRWTAKHELRGHAASEPLEELRRVVHQHGQLEVEISQRVGRLRRDGYSWQLIGDALGITRQSAQARFGGNRSA